MFKGSNTIMLNEATMIVAVQEYLEKRTREGCALQVKSVKMSNSSRGNYADCYEVLVDEKPSGASA